MLTYELCKKLKEAGFPFREVEDYQPANGERVIIKQPFINFEDGKFYWQPTLSELIEACGDDFDRLQQTRMFDQKINRLERWSAWKIRSKKDHFENIAFGGKTPEEAVANLFLALHKK